MSSLSGFFELEDVRSLRFSSRRRATSCSSKESEYWPGELCSICGEIRSKSQIFQCFWGAPNIKKFNAFTSEITTGPNSFFCERTPLSEAEFIGNNCHSNNYLVSRRIFREIIKIYGNYLIEVGGSVRGVISQVIHLSFSNQKRFGSPALLNYLRTRGYTGGITVVKEYLRVQRLALERHREAY